MQEVKSNISVVIPAYNAEKTIGRTLKSILSQSLPPFEVIVVDDGSQDQTAAVAQELGSRIIRTENKGPAAARNKGIKDSRGNIIALIDSDCEAREGWVENLNKTFEDEKVSTVMGRVVIPSSNYMGDSISALGFPAGGAIGFDKVWKVTPEGFTTTLSTCNCAFRKEIIDQVGLFDEEFPFAGGEDTLFAANLIKNGIKIKYCPAIQVIHEPRKNFLPFLRWQIQRGRCAFQFKQKVGAVGGFAKTRLWSTRNVIRSYWTKKEFPLVILLVFLSYVLQGIGFILEFLKTLFTPAGESKHYTLNEVKTWYDQVYAQNPHRFIRDWKEYNRFLHPLGPGPGKTLCDVACGTGGLLKAGMEKGLIPFGLDLSQEGVKLAAEFSGCKSLVVANGEQLPFKSGSFDYMTNIGSLEHFTDPKAGLKDMARVLASDGRMCVVLPNSFGRFGRLIGYTGTGQVMERLSTLREWQSFIEEENLEVISVHRDLGPAALHDKKPLKVMMRLAAKVILPVLPVSCSYQFIFIIRKKTIESV